MAVIYLATNISNEKRYVGFDLVWPNRKSAHLGDAFNSNSKAYDYVIHQAIRKYGKESFKWEVIYSHWDPEYCLSVMEPNFIKAYNSYYGWPNGGYNMTFGGEGVAGLRITEETRNKMRDSHLGQLHSEEHKRKIRESTAKTKWNSRSWYIFVSPEGKEYRVYGLEEFCKEHNLTRHNISGVVSGYRPHHKGWKCRKVT